jgi:hypothetical protein
MSAWFFICRSFKSVPKMRNSKMFQLLDAVNVAAVAVISFRCV